MATAPPDGRFLCIFHFEIQTMFCKAVQDIIMLDSECTYKSNILHIKHILVNLFFPSLATVSVISRFIENFALITD